MPPDVVNETENDISNGLPLLRRWVVMEARLAGVGAAFAGFSGVVGDSEGGGLPTWRRWRGGCAAYCGLGDGGGVGGCWVLPGGGRGIGLAVGVGEQQWDAVQLGQYAGAVCADE